MNRPNHLRSLTSPLRAAADRRTPLDAAACRRPSPLRMRVGPDGLLVPELPVTPPNVPRSRGRRVAAGMTVLFLGWAALDFAVGRLVPLPDGVGGCLMACGLACSIMGLLWAQGVHKR